MWCVCVETLTRRLHVSVVSVWVCRWDALQRLLCRLLTRLYDRAEAAAEAGEVCDMDSLAAVLAKVGGMPPALLAALEAALAATDLDGDYQVLWQDGEGVRGAHLACRLLVVDYQNVGSA